MEKIKIGKIVSAVALKGEVKIYHYSDYKERFEELDRIIVRKGTKNIKESEYKIEKVRYQKDMVIIKLEGIDDRDAAEAMRDSDVLITEDDLRELPENTFYIRDLIGCNVKDSKDESLIGVIKDVLQTSAQDIYQIELKNGKEALIPAVAQFINNVDIEGKTVWINVIPGLLPDK